MDEWACRGEAGGVIVLLDGLLGISCLDTDSLLSRNSR